MLLGEKEVFVIEGLRLKTLVCLTIIGQYRRKTFIIREKPPISQLVLDGQLAAAMEHVHQFVHSHLAHQQGEMLGLFQKPWFRDKRSLCLRGLVHDLCASE